MLSLKLFFRVQHYTNLKVFTWNFRFWIRFIFQINKHYGLDLAPYSSQPEKVHIHSTGVCWLQKSKTRRRNTIREVNTWGLWSPTSRSSWMITKIIYMLAAKCKNHVSTKTKTASATKPRLLVQMHFLRSIKNNRINRYLYLQITFWLTQITHFSSLSSKKMKR